jgi:hypothetical protein
MRTYFSKNNPARSAFALGREPAVQLSICLAAFRTRLRSRASSAIWTALGLLDMPVVESRGG